MIRQPKNPSNNLVTLYFYQYLQYITHPEPFATHTRNMTDFSHTKFLVSAQKFRQCPQDSGAEVAFAGRSNAGKSSALNAITGVRSLARTSKTPGRTQLINFFSLDEHRRLVDLPGYGFAKVPERVKQEWQRELGLYLERRQALRGLVLLMDIRHPLKEYDRQMLDWCHRAELPVHVLLTKADKLSRGAANGVLQKTRHALARDYPLCSIQLFSALKQTGVEEARAQLLNWFADE